MLFSGQDIDDNITEQVAATLTKSRSSNEELIQTVKRLLKNS
jgi:phage gp37-like protein